MKSVLCPVEISPAVEGEEYILMSINELLRLPEYSLWVDKKWAGDKIKDNLCIFARHENAVVGALTFCFYGEVMMIETLAVIEPRCGVGTKLVNEAKRIWEGSNRMVLHVGSFEVYNAVEFYKKLGFEEDSKREFGGLPIVMLRMVE